MLLSIWASAQTAVATYSSHLISDLSIIAVLFIYLFTYCLFKDAANCADYIALNDGMINE
jgi:hypothetical protein